MGLRARVMGWITDMYFEGPAAKLSFDRFATRLEEDGQELAQLLAGVSDSPRNRKQLGHIIGIERWGTRRLQTALGQPLMMDEYDGYRPAPTASWDTIRQEFKTTRQATVALARELGRAEHLPATIPHNQLGELSPRGWLRYLLTHANREKLLIR